MYSDKLHQVSIFCKLHASKYSKGQPGFHSYRPSGKCMPCTACIQDIRNQYRENSCSIDSCWNYIPEWSSCNSRAQLCRLSYLSRICNKLIGQIVAKSHTLQIGTCYRVSCVLTCCERQCWKWDQWVEHCNDMHGIICLAMHTNTSTWKINNRKALQIGTLGNNVGCLSW